MVLNSPQPPFEPSLRLELGLRPLPRLSDAASPTPVDREQIRALLEGRLAEPEFRRVLRLIHSYREWHDAQIEVILEQNEI